MTSIVIDRLNEEDFRRSIENRLREKRAGVAIERLRRLIEPYARPGGILPERFLTVDTGDLVLSGWEALDQSIRRYDRPGAPITAISIAFGWPGEEPRPRNAAGHLPPYVETRYFTDAAFPFSESTRDDLLEGYSSYGCSWGDDCEAVDTVLAVEGIDDLHAALSDLEEVLLASEQPDEDGLRAGSLGACLLSALLFQAVSEQIDAQGLPRPLCVTSGSSGVYPYFDAPVIGMPAQARPAAQDWFDDAAPPVAATAQPVWNDDISQGAPACRYSSLLVTGIPRAKKRAVLVLDESPDEMANRLAALRSNGAEVPEVPAGMPLAAAPTASADDPGQAILPDLTGTSPLMVKKPHARPAEASAEPTFAEPPAPVAEQADPAIADLPAPAAEQADPPIAESPAPIAEPADPAPVNLDAHDWLRRLVPGGIEPEREWTVPPADAAAPAAPAAWMAPEAPVALSEATPEVEAETAAEVAEGPAPRRMMAALGALLAGIKVLWQNRKGPPPPQRRRFPPR